MHKKNPRDNIINAKLIFNMFAEASTKDITEAIDSRTLAHKAVAWQDDTIVRNARLELEARTGKMVVLRFKAKRVLVVKNTLQIEVARG